MGQQGRQQQQQQQQQGTTLALVAGSSSSSQQELATRRHRAWTKMTKRTTQSCRLKGALGSSNRSKKLQGRGMQRLVQVGQAAKLGSAAEQKYSCNARILA